MNRITGKGWKHPGRNSSNYGKSSFHDHDHRSYSTMEDFSGQGPKNYMRHDVSIHEEICEALYWNADVDASQINVRVQNGMVYLEGGVDSRHAKKTAERVCESIRGVEDIFNRLVINDLFDVMSDKTISRGDDGLFTKETHPR